MNWKTEAVAWLRAKAAEQDQINKRWPDHTKCYSSWTERVKTAQDLADELEQEADAERAVPVDVKPAAIQRYEPEIWREDRIRMEPDATGDWVKLVDVEAMFPVAQPVAREPIGGERKPLPVERINAIWDDTIRLCDPITGSTHIKFTRALEAAHGINPTSAKGGEA